MTYFATEYTELKECTESLSYKNAPMWLGSWATVARMSRHLKAI